MKRELETVTVGELIEWLRKIDPKMPIVYAYPFDLRRGMEMAGQIEQGPKLGHIRWSRYHDQHVLADHEDDETTKVVVLR